ncbi:hypothetical protein ES703_102975 [subsurface metagenome]
MLSGIAKYVYAYFYRIEVQPIIMSLEVWNSLSKEDQEIVEEAAEIAIAKGWEVGQKVEDYYKDRLVSKYGFEEIIELTPEQHKLNVKAVRDEVWPKLDELIGKDLMDGIRKYAAPLPD